MKVVAMTYAVVSENDVEMPQHIHLSEGERIVAIETLPDTKPQWHLKMYRRRKGVIEPMTHLTRMRVWIEIP